LPIMGRFFNCRLTLGRVVKLFKTQELLYMINEETVVT
jgi:hypothetical protein